MAKILGLIVLYDFIFLTREKNVMVWDSHPIQGMIPLTVTLSFVYDNVEESLTCIVWKHKPTVDVRA